MSHSQYRTWLACPSAAKAKQDGLYKPEVTQAMLVGSYIDSAVTQPDKFAAWCEENTATIYGKKGDKYKVFETADAVIRRVQSDPLYPVLCASGKWQVEVRGIIGGVEWIGVEDWRGQLFGSDTVLDLKSTASFEDEWAVIAPNRRQPVPWYDAAGYWRALAVYRELDRQTFPQPPHDPNALEMQGLGLPVMGILAASKQDPPAVGLWMMTCDEALSRFARELNTIIGNLPRILAWKSGDAEPTACGLCEWCRSQSSYGQVRVAKSQRSVTMDG